MTVRCRPGTVAGTVELASEDAVEDVVDQRRLAGAGHPGDRDEAAERERHRHVAQVVLAGAAHHQLAAGGARAPDVGQLDAPLAGEVGAGERVTAGQQVLDRAGHDDLAAVLARTRPDVDDPVGRAGWCPRRARRRSGCCPGRAAGTSVSISRRLSRWCSPMHGSSST